MSDETLSNFMAVTGCESEETARFFLDSSKNDLEAAIGMFMDSGGRVPEDATQDAEPAQPSTAANVAVSAMPDDEQRWYTGGGAGSGQEVIAPGQAGTDVNALFEGLRPHAREGTSEDLSGQQGAFTGSARTLDGQIKKAKESKQAVIRFYTNEIFTVNNGPPRSIHDPDSASFIDKIRRRECPDELADGNAEVQISIMQVQKDYEASEHAPVAFSGQGRKLTDGPSTSQASGPAREAVPAWAGADESKPVTSIQIRLPDGSRMVGRFNHDQGVSMIRSFVIAARPDLKQLGGMVTGFPQKPVEDEQQTIADAGLVNAVVIFR